MSSKSVYSSNGFSKVISLGFLLVLMYVSMGHCMWGWPMPAFFEHNPVAIGLVQMLLAASVMLINKKFFNHDYLGDDEYIYSTFSIAQEESNKIRDGIINDSLNDCKIPHKIIHQTNQGVSVARNTGAQLAFGLYLAFLDADDEWEPGYLEEINRMICANKSCEVFGTNYRGVGFSEIRELRSFSNKFKF